MGTLAELHRLCAFLEQTGVRPLVDSEHSLAEARPAFTRLETGAEFGKIVVVP
jgi:D-arabinose 1-dehydrogenase-like Zn-dependent alcohol dehydrogenase